MTEKELDELMRRILKDSLETDQEELGERNVSFTPGAGYQRQIKAMLANPVRWAAKRATPVWRRTLRAAVMFTLAAFLGFGGIMTASPAARGAFRQWIQEMYQTFIIYRYADESEMKTPLYEIRALPEGYAETDRSEDENSVLVVYGNGEYEIYFSYAAMDQGNAVIFSGEDADITDVKVNGYDGKFFTAHSAEDMNTLTWLDTRSNLQFILDGHFSLEDMLNMAGSVGK